MLADSIFDLRALFVDLAAQYGIVTAPYSNRDVGAALVIDGKTVGIGFMSMPVPAHEINSTARFAYNWPDAAADLSVHQSHILISVSGGKSIERYILFTQIISAALCTTNAIGVYLGEQTMLIPKEDFLDQANLMSDDYLPLNLWIYFGLQAGKEGNSGYTYGLKAFGKPEMEILDSEKSLEDVRVFLFNMAHYVLDYDVTFTDGETCGVSEDERVTITVSNGQFVEGETIKFLY